MPYVAAIVCFTCICESVASQISVSGVERKAGWPMGLMGPKEVEKSHSSRGRTDGGWVDVCTV